MVGLQVLDVSPASNPDKIKFLATFTGNYGVNGTGDPLNLAPYSAGNNPGGFTNPKNIPLPEMPFGFDEAPSVASENLGGSYVQLNTLAPTGATNGVANTVAPINGFAARMFEPGGAEKATNAAYTAAELAGGIILEVQLPKNQ